MWKTSSGRHAHIRLGSHQAVATRRFGQSRIGKLFCGNDEDGPKRGQIVDVNFCG